MSKKRKYDEMNRLSPLQKKNDYLSDNSDSDNSDHNLYQTMYQNIKEYNSLPKDDPLRNLCVICKEDMGYNNPRQLCGKIYCINEN